MKGIIPPENFFEWAFRTEFEEDISQERTEGVARSIINGDYSFIDYYKHYLERIVNAELTEFLRLSVALHKLLHFLEREDVYKTMIKKIPDITTDEQIKRIIDNAIERMGSENTIKNIASFFRYTEIDELLTKLLGFFDKDRVFKSLINFYAETDDNILSERIFNYLLNNAEEAIPYIDTFLESKDMVLVTKGLRILGKAQGNECLSRIGKFLEHPNPVIQREALRVLMELDNTHCVQIIKDRFFYLTGDEQMEALKFLSRKGEIKFIHKIKEMPGLSMNRGLFELVKEILGESK